MRRFELLGATLSVETLGRGGTRAYADRVIALFGSSIVAYWPLSETSGITAFDISGNNRHGVHTGVTLGQPGIGDGKTAPLYDGANDYTNVHSASLAAAFNGAEGSLLLWLRVANSGVWADGAFRNALHIAADVTNRLFIQKTSTANQLRVRYEPGGTAEQVDITLSTTGWFAVALTWSKSADQALVYLNGVQQGATQTGLNTWAGAPASTTTAIGAASTTPTNPWHGYIAHAILLDRPATPAEVAEYARV